MGVALKSAEPAAAPEAPVANLGWLLGQASHVLATKLTAALEDVGITPRSFCLLSKAMTGTFTQSELAQAVGVDKTTMVVTMDELESAGLAKRVASPHDRRARVIAVTKAGERAVARGEEIVDAIHEQVLESLPARERKVFVDALVRLVSDGLSQTASCSRPVRRREPRVKSVHTE